ncbi:MAG: virulence factor [Actinomycetota bacterium]
MSEGVTVIFWKDIPAQVMSGSGRDATRVALPDRFQEAVDRAATRTGLTDSDAYSTQWHKVRLPGPDAHVVADQLDADYPDTTLDALVRNGGQRP